MSAGLLRQQDFGFYEKRQGSDPKFHGRIVKTLQEGIKQSPINKEMTLFRTMALSDFSGILGDELTQQHVGKFLQPKGFTSTATEPAVAMRGWGGSEDQVLMQIQASPGTKAIPIGAAPSFNETEMLLGHKQQYQLKNIEHFRPEELRHLVEYNGQNILTDQVTEDDYKRIKACVTLIPVGDIDKLTDKDIIPTYQR